MHNKIGLFGVFVALSLAVLTSSALASNIQILDIYPNTTTGGNLTVILNLTNASVLYNTFNFWFDKNATTGYTYTAGPFNHTTNDTTNQSYVVNVMFNQNGTLYNASLFTPLLPLNVTKLSPSNSNITNVTFIFNSSYNYSMDMINITLGTAVYDQGGVNSTMATRNYVAINTSSSTNVLIANAIIMPFNNITRLLTDSVSPVVSDSMGFFGEHCNGVVNGGICSYPPIGSATPNFCIEHGVTFQPPGAPAGSINPSNKVCSINATTTIMGLNLVSSNMTIPQNVSVGTPFNLTINRTGSMNMIMAMGFTFNPGPPQFFNISSVVAYNATDLTLAVNQTITTDGGQGPPLFLTPFQPYIINVTYTNGTATISANYSFMPTTSGVFGAMIMVPMNASGLTTLRGQVLNSSGSSVVGAIVYAQMNGFSGPPMGIPFMNSTTTDSNGKFLISVPTSQQVTQQGCDNCPPMYMPTYQIFVVAQNLSSGGVPQYFPTLDTNSQRGYAAIGSQVIMPPITLKSGGQISANVTLNNATGLMSEVSHLLNQVAGFSRNLFSGKMTFLKMFSGISMPASITVNLLAPTNATPTALGAIIYGQSQSFGSSNAPITGMCINNTLKVTQGVSTAMTCNLATPAYINLTVKTCTSLFPPTNCGLQPNFISGFAGGQFWFMNKLIIRNMSDNTILNYLDQNGFIINNLMMSSPATSILIPVPSPGNYTVELVPGFDFSSYVGVANSTNVTVNSTINGTIVLNTLSSNFGEPWRVEPRFPPSLVLTGNNNINISVMDPNPNVGVLTDSRTNASVNVTGQFANLDKTTVGTSFYFAFNNDTNNWGAVVSLSDRGITQAGKYLLMINVSNATSTGRFSLYRYFPVSAADFQLFLDASPFTFGAGSAIKAKIFAFNSTTGQPISDSSRTGLTESTEANATANATITAYDQNGNVVTGYPVHIFNITGNAEQTPVNQSVSLPAINTTGFYSLVTNVTANSTQTNTVVHGLSDTWIQISNLGASLSTDRSSYQVNDNVILTVKITNSTSGSGIANAALSISVDNSQTTLDTTTGSDGTAVASLNPTAIKNANWTYGFHQIQATVSVDTGASIVKQTLYSGFDVRGLQLFVQPTQPTYAVGSNATINIFGAQSQPTVTVDGTTAVSSSSIVSLGQNAWQATIVTPTAGHHNVKVQASGSGGSQDIYTGFDVNAYNIIATTNAFTYDVNTNISLTVTLLNVTTGAAINSKQVDATLFKAQSSSDVNVSFGRVTTNTTGQVTIPLNASQPGFNYIKLNVSGESRFIGVQVSSIKVTLLSAARNNAGSVVNKYSGSPGSTIVIYVNATNGAANVTDSSTVSANVWAFGKQIPLPTNTTGADIPGSAASSGNATIYFTIPSDVPSGTYGLDVKVTDTTGNVGFAAPATLLVTGGNAISMAVSTDKPFINSYTPASSQKITAMLKFPNGTAASGYNVSLETGSGSGTPTSLGSVITSVTGTASVTTTAPTSDGSYYIHAYVTNTSAIQAYSGFFVSSINVTLATANTTYNPGDTISVNVTVYNITSGSQVSATGGFVSVFNKNKGMIPTSINTSLSQPYIVNVTVANESSSLGALPIGAMVFVSSTQGMGFTLVKIVNSTGNATFTLPTINANEQFSMSVTTNGNTSTTGSLQIFSPSASNVSYSNASVPLGQSFAIPSTAITKPGVYVVSITVPGVGTNTTIININSTASGTTLPGLWTSSGGTNTTSFSNGGVMTIWTNTGNSTASVFYKNATTGATTKLSLPISQASGSNFNTTHTLSATGTYFVRLDTTTAVGAAGVIVTVS